jgi:hypothetical protein
VVKRDPVFDTLIKHGVAAFQREDYRTARKQFSQAILRMWRGEEAPGGDKAVRRAAGG